MSKLDDLYKRVYESVSLFDRDVLDRYVDRERKKERNKVVTELIKSVHSLSNDVPKTKKTK